MKKRIEFKDTKIIDDEEYVNRYELERDYDIKKSSKLFARDPITKEKKYIPGSWKRIFRIDFNTILIVAIVVLGFLFFQTATQECRAVMESPCDYCSGAIMVEGLNIPRFTGIVNTTVTNESVVE